MTQFCIECGGALRPSAKFCTKCGNVMVVDDSSASQLAHTGKGSLSWLSRYYPYALGIAAILGLAVASGVYFFGKPLVQTNAAGVVVSAVAENTITGQVTNMYIVADANVRDRATAQGSNILRKIVRGTSVSGVMQIGEDGESQWFKLNGDAGFVGAVNLSGIVPPKLAKILNDQIWYAPQLISIFALPDINSAVIASLDVSESVTLAGVTESNFVEVKLKKGGVGYVNASGLDLSRSRVTSLISTQELTNLVGFQGAASDQNIDLSFSQRNGFIDGRGTYYNKVTGNRCESRLTYKGTDNAGNAHIFSQGPLNGSPACDASPDIYISGIGETIDARWMDYGRQLLSAKLDGYGD